MLGRYRSDLNLLSRNDRDGLFQIDEHTGGIVFPEKPDMDIKFMTAHASKGLQRDFVFLLCCSGGLKGFPSAIPEEPLLGLLLPGLYVAMAAFHPQMLPTELLHRSSLNIYARSASQPSSSFWGVPLWRAPHL